MQIINALQATALLSLALVVTGCATSPPSTEETAVISGSSGRKVPDGLHPAVLVYVDGQRIATGQRAVAVASGEHLVIVAPVVAGPVQQVPSATYLVSHFSNQPLYLDVAAGRTYVVGLRFTEPFDVVQLAGAWEAVLVEAPNPLSVPDQESP